MALRCYQTADSTIQGISIIPIYVDTSNMRSGDLAYIHDPAIKDKSIEVTDWKIIQIIQQSLTQGPSHRVKYFGCPKA